VRIIVPWDVAERPFRRTACDPDDPSKPRGGDVNGQYAHLKDWVRNAKAQGRTILVSFGRCARQPEYATLPTPRQYKRAILRFLNNRNFQGIQFFTAWNEPNSDGQPTSTVKNGDTGPKRAGQFWSSFQKLCVDPDYRYRCTVAAGDFVDDRFFPGYFPKYRRAMTRQPSVWAIHPYVAGNQLGSTRRADRMKAFIRATRRSDAADPKIWITEAGGIVNSKNFPNRSEETARAAARELFDVVVDLSDRITRFYYYALFGDPPTKFDSGLLRYAGHPLGGGTKRPVFEDYRARVGRTGMTP